MRHARRDVRAAVIGRGYRKVENLIDRKPADPPFVSLSEFFARARKRAGAPQTSEPNQAEPALTQNVRGRRIGKGGIQYLPE